MYGVPKKDDKNHIRARIKTPRQLPAGEPMVKRGD